MQLSFSKGFKYPKQSKSKFIKKYKYLRESSKYIGPHRNKILGVDASPPNPDRFRSGNRNTKNSDSLCNLFNGAKLFIIHGPGHSYGECKVLNGFG